MTYSPFGMGDLFGGTGVPETPLQRAARESLANNQKRSAPVPKDKPMPQIRGKRIDGVLYVRADDVADALQTQVPTAAARLIAKLQGAG